MRFVFLLLVEGSTNREELLTVILHHLPQSLLLVFLQDIFLLIKATTNIFEMLVIIPIKMKRFWR